MKTLTKAPCWEQEDLLKPKRIEARHQGTAAETKLQEFVAARFSRVKRRQGSLASPRLTSAPTLGIQRALERVEGGEAG